MEAKNPPFLHEKSALYEDQQWHCAAWSDKAPSNATTKGNDSKEAWMPWDQPISHVHKPWNTGKWDEVTSAPATTQSKQSCSSSSEEHATMTATMVLNNSLRASKAFFSKKDESDDEDEDEFDEKDMYDYNDVVNSKYYTFFKDMFVEDTDLRAYYSDKWDKGLFCCLACEGLRVKTGRKYPDAVSLVQHSQKITKTKSRLAHRALGRVICTCLGWDINHLPNVNPLPAEQTRQLSDKVDANDNTSEWRNYTSKARGKRWNTWYSKDYATERESKVRGCDYEDENAKEE